MANEVLEFSQFQRQSVQDTLLLRLGSCCLGRKVVLKGRGEIPIGNEPDENLRVLYTSLQDAADLSYVTTGHGDDATGNVLFGVLCKSSSCTELCCK